MDLDGGKDTEMKKSLRRSTVFLCSLVLVGILGCSQADTTNMQTLLDKISHAPESELPALLFGYGQSSPGAQQILLSMLRPLRAPSPQQHMSVEDYRHAGRLTMIVALVPWQNSPHPRDFLPIIITGDVGKEQVVGTVLPFDDIIPLLNAADRQSGYDLAGWWVEHYGQRGRSGR